MIIKKYLTKKNIIIFTIILVLIIGIEVTIICLNNNTVLFKNSEQINNDLSKIQDDLISDENAGIEDSVYKDYVGVSNGTLYIKENADDKIKEAAKDSEIKFQKTDKSDGKMLVIEPKVGTDAVSCKVVSNTEDIVRLTVYTANNLCEASYTVGSIKDKSTVEKGEDNLEFVRVEKNTTYTISNIFNEGINTIFFFDKEGKFISSTTENTFTTPENAKYIKVITEIEGEMEEGLSIRYCLVLGESAGEDFGFTTKSDIAIDVNNPNEVYFPMEGEKLVIYVDGGEIELSYVAN